MHVPELTDDAETELTDSEAEEAELKLGSEPGELPKLEADDCSETELADDCSETELADDCSETELADDAETELADDPELSSS